VVLLLILTEATFKELSNPDAEYTETPTSDVDLLVALILITASIPSGHVYNT
jgi:hypothetical protein